MGRLRSPSSVYSLRVSWWSAPTACRAKEGNAQIVTFAKSGPPIMVEWCDRPRAHLWCLNLTPRSGISKLTLAAGARTSGHQDAG